MLPNLLIERRFSPPRVAWKQAEDDSSPNMLDMPDQFTIEPNQRVVAEYQQEIELQRFKFFDDYTDHYTTIANIKTLPLKNW